MPPEASTVTYNSLDYDNVNKFYSYTPSDPAGENLITVGTIQVTGGEMILMDPNGAVVGKFD